MAGGGEARASSACSLSVLALAGFVWPNAILRRALVGFVWPSVVLFMFKHCFYYGFARWLCLCNPLALFAQNVKNGCATELTQAAVDGAASLGPSAALNGTRIAARARVR